MNERLDGLHNEQYYTESFQGNFKKYGQIKEGVEDVLKQAIEDVFIDRHGQEAGERLLRRSHGQARQSLSSVTTSASLLREQKTEKIVGFGYAIPASLSQSPLYVEESIVNKLSPDEFEKLQENSAEVGWVAILDKHRGQGGWTLMMNSLEARLQSRGYDHMTRFVRKDNGYAEKLKRRYGEHIIYEREYNEPDYLGEQVYFRTRLK